MLILGRLDSHWYRSQLWNISTNGFLGCEFMVTATLYWPQAQHLGMLFHDFGLFDLILLFFFKHKPTPASLRSFQTNNTIVTKNQCPSSTYMTPGFESTTFRT